MFPVLFRTVIIYILVILAMRLMGKRQLGELQPAELVTTFLISNVASICIEEPELPFLYSFAPILLIAALELLNSSAAWRWPRYATLLFGRSITVIRDGEVDQTALEHMRISAADLAEALRSKDIFSPREVAWGVIEPNGSLSVARKPQPQQSPPMLPLLIDGQLYSDNLRSFGRDEAWLAALLQQQGLERRGVLMLLYNGEEALLIRKKDRPAKGGTVRKG